MPRTCCLVPQLAISRCMISPCAPLLLAGEPKGQTYGGVYQPGPEEQGVAEAATYSSPTRE